jgi:DNA-binding GntR family transcriptional regulator
MPDSLNPAPGTPRKNLAREVLLSLRGEIISGRLLPGAPLAEPVLARRFGSSRAPVREALIELEREGLVQFESTGRTKVRTLTERDFEEIRDARVALESMAARKAAARWTPKATEIVEQNIARQDGASTLAELSRLDVELHEYVMRFAANRRLLALWQSIRWQFEMCLASTHRLQQELAFKPRQISVNSHRQLLSALASGKPEYAAQKMATHIENSMEWVPGETVAAESTAASPAAKSRKPSSSRS